MDKKIIGYKCPTDLWNGDIEKDTVYVYSGDKNYYPSEQNEEAFYMPKEIVETWWEPIYEEEFKVGDAIIVIDPKTTSSCGLVINHLYYIIEIAQNTQYNSEKYCACSNKPEGDRLITGDIKLSGIRKATLEEITASQYPQITINNYKGKFFDDYVKFGCAEIDKDLFIDLDNLGGGIGNKSIESVTIGKGVFTKEQIKEIATYYSNK